MKPNSSARSLRTAFKNIMVLLLSRYLQISDLREASGVFECSLGDDFCQVQIPLEILGAKIRKISST